MHAAMNGDRVDVSHPKVVAWVGPIESSFVYGMTLAMARELGLIQRPKIQPLLRETAVTVGEFATIIGKPPAEAAELLHGEFAVAVIPPGHISVEEFAARADVDDDEVVAALETDLASALLPSGRIDLGHPASLAFMAARPFDRTASGDIAGTKTILGTPWLAPACVGEDVDLDHAVARAFMARADGRVRTDAELEAAI